jgi:hypothetical protein
MICIMTFFKNDDGHHHPEALCQTMKEIRMLEIELEQEIKCVGRYSW